MRRVQQNFRKSTSKKFNKESPTSADGPDRFVGKHNAGPVGNVGQHGGQLGEHNLLGLAGLALFQLFSEARDDLGILSIYK